MSEYLAAVELLKLVITKEETAGKEAIFALYQECLKAVAHQSEPEAPPTEPSQTTYGRRRSRL